MPSAPLQSWREITAKLFPWAKGFKLSAISGGLRILAAGYRIHLAGDSGDPAAIRSSDTAGRLVLDPGIPSTTPPAIYYQAPGAATFVPVATVAPGSTAGGTVPTLPGSTPATTVELGPGSSLVSIA